MIIKHAFMVSKVPKSALLKNNKFCAKWICRPNIHPLVSIFGRLFNDYISKILAKTDFKKLFPKIFSDASKWIVLFFDVSSTSVSNPFFHLKNGDLAYFDVL